MNRLTTLKTDCTKSKSVIIKGSWLIIRDDLISQIIAEQQNNTAGGFIRTAVQALSVLRERIPRGVMLRGRGRRSQV
jgi:hypothetical protein